ncbi:hypothetical protein [Micrococcus luteus]
MTAAAPTMPAPDLADLLRAIADNGRRLARLAGNVRTLEDRLDREERQP